MANRLMKDMWELDFRFLVLFLLIIIIVLEFVLFAYLADVQTQVIICQKRIESLEAVSEAKNETVTIYSYGNYILRGR